MHYRSLFVFVLLCAAGTAFAQAYKWTDENGVVHYSDRPQPGAEEFVLPESRPATRIVPPRASAPRPDREEEPEEEPDTGYNRLDIVTPDAEETLWNIQGNLNVQLDLQPSLKRGHQIRVYFDGEPRMVSGPNFTLTEVYRGSHNLQVEVVDATGRLQIRSTPIRFYVQQTSIVGSSNPSAVPR